MGCLRSLEVGEKRCQPIELIFGWMIAAYLIQMGRDLSLFHSLNVFITEIRKGNGWKI